MNSYVRERKLLREEALKRPSGVMAASEAIGIAAEAVRRIRGLTAYDEQLLAGLILADGNLAEMAAGEGKTLVAALVGFVFALRGRGVHVATVNDYLAKRDCAFAQPIFESRLCALAARQKGISG